MATRQLTLPGEIVKKHNRLVRAKINLTGKTASRLLACLIAAISADDQDFRNAYSVPLKNYLPDVGGKFYKLARQACRDLAQATVEMERPDPDPTAKDPIFEIMPFFSRLEYRNGIVEAEFNKHMAPVLLQLRECFTQYNLMEYLALPSVYSQRIFEILKSWENIKKGEVIFSMSEFHRMLGTPQSFINDFRQFRIRVIEKAYKDIHEKTPLRFEWEPIKVGKSVEKIRFIFGARRALAEKVKADAKEEKRQRIASQRLLRAVECAKKKGGECPIADNVRIVCRVCAEFRCCESVQRRLKP